MKIIVHTDGGARGNPGPAAVGVVIEIIENSEFRIQNDGTKQKTKLITEFGKRIGEATNNVAEYTAVLEGLRTINNQLLTINKEGEKIEIQFFIDSTLAVNQLNGLFKVKDAKLRELLVQIRLLEQEIGGVVIYAYVPREQNRRADWLVNKALDG
ncbi:ribonuclease HI family protein [Candidatus Gottesmanbacteria bacterium]|nr:ribonuclease HI family protein [Candidatus Gottesmanbacteria bacterium]